MKIKKTKQMNIIGLFEHIFRSQQLVEKHLSNCGKYEVIAVHNGMISIADSGENQGLVDIPIDATFTTEVEEELTEDTLLQDVKLIGLTRKGERRVNYEMSEWSCPPDARANISGIKEIYDLKSLHKVNGDGSLTLLYTEEHGIPTDGVLEVDSNA
ncbi:hypothetical protein ACBR55_12200 [Salinicoccus roseus]|uniref:hypothetical protein n=1 Tax=Salinicoccus roseus TaxID=45670 RepID=UPI0035258A49